MTKTPNLKKLRESKFLSQQELAATAKVSRTTVVNLESGAEARGKTIRDLAGALGVEPQDLVGE